MTGFVLFVLIIIIILYIMPRGHIAKLGKKRVLYYVNESPIDNNFVKSVIDIISTSNWNKTFDISNTKNKGEADVIINLSERSSLDKWHDNPKYYPDGTQIRYSITTQTPVNRPKIFIDSINWLKGVDASKLSLEKYRRYVINHEFGHALGYGHNVCSAENVYNNTCPVMHQSTIGCGMYNCGYEVSIYDYDVKIPERYIR